MTAAAWPFLAIALAALLPLIIHFIMRRRMRTIVFPSNALIELIRRNEGMRSRIAHILLLIVRMSLIVLIAAAAARFFLNGRGMFSDIEQWYVLIDNSPSMDRPFRDGRLMSDVTARADALARELHLRAGTSITIVTADGAVGTSTRYGDTHRMIGQLRMSARSFSLAEAITAAERSSLNARAAVMLFTDAQMSVFSNASVSDMPAVLCCPDADNSRNAAVIDVSLPKKMLYARTVMPLTVEIARTKYPSGRIVRAFHGDTLLSMAPVPPGDGTVRVPISVNVRSAGAAFITVMLDGDSTASDNVFHTAFAAVSGLTIAAAGEGKAVERIKAALSQDERCVFRPLEKNAAAYDAVICPVGAASPLVRNAAIRIIVPEADARNEDVSAAAADASIGTAVARSTGAVMMPSAAMRTSESVPIGSFYRARSVPPDVESPVVADDGSGLVLVRRSETLRTTTAFISVPFSPENEPFYSSAAFVIIVNRLLSDAVAFRSRIEHRSVGDRVMGTAVQYSSNGVQFTSYVQEHFALPGFYRGDGSYAVNADRSERVYARADAGRFFRRSIDITDAGDDAASRIRSSFALSPIFIGLIILLAACEMMLSANVRFRRRYQ